VHVQRAGLAGYAVTTVADIARRARVAVDTVYAAVGRKPALLREVLETAISGSDEAVPAEQRDYVARVRGNGSSSPARREAASDKAGYAASPSIRLVTSLSFARNCGS
jgi:AcrR family transcriptional regulator